MQGQKRQGGRRRGAAKPKVCRFCESKVNYIDFKDAETLMKFQTEKGKILPRRITGNCLDHQKKLAIAIKRARVIALVY
ncbi:MAG: 30S ribosomal protein S18 [Lentisphaeria bacterium]|jgi:small subunit ribosomal protein S18|nr:30S ribosomal protein S18 [Lentisphaeria bacterium]MBR2911286.1 30S ribosomal protein S18 [Lentisphaeria bacterium]MBR7103681.1 30S ribosomal protein S18 [Lentisphaeria bacterium]